MKPNCILHIILAWLIIDIAVCSFDRSMINAPGPCVLFATPGMISGGFSLEVFKHWAPSPINLITLPGYAISISTDVKKVKLLKICSFDLL